MVFQLAHVVEGTDHPLPDEDNMIDEHWMIHEMVTTNNFARDNKALCWFVGGLNFQIEHHLFPRVCSIHYPAISPIVEKTADEFNIPTIIMRPFLKRWPLITVPSKNLAILISLIQKQGVYMLSDLAELRGIIEATCVLRHRSELWQDLHFVTDSARFLGQQPESGRCFSWLLPQRILLWWMKIVVNSRTLTAPKSPIVWTHRYLF
ncbi:MAG: fatty acid desaturase [Balneolaceae bacterium]|nr:fatty acid desaturase [Balneolaceae bacterium]